MRDQLKQYLEQNNHLSIDEKVSIVNELREIIHSFSPMNSEPVDFVKWVKNDTVFANDYNPNSVATPEMELLKLSIQADGYTQPIVSMVKDNEGNREVIDGFHRNRVGKEDKEIQGRIFGFLPVVTIKEDRTDKGDRIASTIRHNRARGKHKIDAMSDIVIDLKKRNWSDNKIAKNLGMDADEVLRLTQIGGLVEMFNDKEFSKSWEADNFNDYDNETI